jgi:hypothetical protein
MTTGGLNRWMEANAVESTRRYAYLPHFSPLFDARPHFTELAAHGQVDTVFLNRNKDLPAFPQKTSWTIKSLKSMSKAPL